MKNGRAQKLAREVTRKINQKWGASDYIQAFRINDKVRVGRPVIISEENALKTKLGEALRRLIQKKSLAVELRKTDPNGPDPFPFEAEESLLALQQLHEEDFLMRQFLKLFGHSPARPRTHVFLELFYHNFS